MGPGEKLIEDNNDGKPVIIFQSGPEGGLWDLLDRITEISLRYPNVNAAEYEAKLREHQGRAHLEGS